MNKSCVSDSSFILPPSSLDASRGGAVVARQAHNLEVAGSNPAPGSKDGHSPERKRRFHPNLSLALRAMKKVVYGIQSVSPVRGHVGAEGARVCHADPGTTGG